MHEGNRIDDQLTEQPSTADAAEQSALPKDFQSDGETIISGLQQLIEGRPVLTVASALVATLFAAVTQDSLDRPAKEALSTMVYDLVQNVLVVNEISQERIEVIMAQRAGVAVMATSDGSIMLEAPEEEQG